MRGSSRATWGHPLHVHLQRWAYASGSVDNAYTCASESDDNACASKSDDNAYACASESDDHGTTRSTDSVSDAFPDAAAADASSHCVAHREWEWRAEGSEPSVRLVEA